MNQNTRVILLDGVGINYKTTIMKLARDHGYITVESDSSYYDIADKSIFENKDNFFTKLQCRYMEIMTALSVAKSQERNVFIDRGLLNQVIWASMNYHEIVDDYTILNCDCERIYDDYVSKLDLNLSKEEFQRLYHKQCLARVLNIKNKVVELENNIITDRILLTTSNRRIIEASLDERKYDTDSHAMFRIDTFYDYDNYMRCQKFYTDLYHDYCNNIKGVINIPNSELSPSDQAKLVYQEIIRLCQL